MRASFVPVVTLGLALAAGCLPALPSTQAGDAPPPTRPGGFKFDTTIPREVLENFLARSVSMEGLLNGRGDLKDNIRMLKSEGAKYIGRALCLWGTCSASSRSTRTHAGRWAGAARYHAKLLKWPPGNSTRILRGVDHSLASDLPHGQASVIVRPPGTLHFAIPERSELALIKWMGKGGDLVGCFWPRNGPGNRNREYLSGEDTAAVDEIWRSAAWHCFGFLLP